MKRLFIAAGRWLDDRLGIAELVAPSMKHLVPHDAGWWYVFGSATLVAFIVQVVTGVALAFSYVSSSSQAYETLVFITRILSQGVGVGWQLQEDQVSCWLNR